MDLSLPKESIFLVHGSYYEDSTVQALTFKLFLLAGGLFTGADEVKSENDRTSYGGLANAILDPCYHQVGFLQLKVIKSYCEFIFPVLRYSGQY